MTPRGEASSSLDHTDDRRPVDDSTESVAMGAHRQTRQHVSKNLSALDAAIADPRSQRQTFAVH